MKKSLISIISLLIFSVSINSEIISQPETEYKSELIKFYLDRGEYELALSSFANLDTQPSDSLKLMQGIAFSKIDSTLQAALCFADIKMLSGNDSLKVEAFKLFNEIVDQLEPINKIDLLSKILENSGQHIDVELLLLLANTYENVRLFSEANDIYSTIINSDTIIDTNKFLINYGINEIHQKNYDRASEIFGTIISKNDTLHIQDALFYSYISNYSSDNKELAKEQLLKLHYRFPDNFRNKEILQQLADIFSENKQYLLSWYFLNKLHKISDPTEKYKISLQISEIKNRLNEEELKLDQFEFLKPTFLEKYQTKIDSTNNHLKPLN